MCAESVELFEYMLTKLSTAPHALHCSLPFTTRPGSELLSVILHSILSYPHDGLHLQKVQPGLSFIVKLHCKTTCALIAGPAAGQAHGARLARDAAKVFCKPPAVSIVSR
jgi:hypothetical protein